MSMRRASSRLKPPGNFAVLRSNLFQKIRGETGDDALDVAALMEDGQNDDADIGCVIDHEMPPRGNHAKGRRAMPPQESCLRPFRDRHHRGIELRHIGARGLLSPLFEKMAVDGAEVAGRPAREMKTDVRHDQPFASRSARVFMLVSKSPLEAKMRPAARSA